MKKIDPTVIKETKYIALWVIILSVLMQAVFFIIGKWAPAVLFANLLVGAAAVFNFLFMGITVQKALEKDEKEAKGTMRVSQLYRFLFLLAATVCGAVFFNIWAAVIPLLFPRIAIAFRPLFDGKKS